jgi:hypothetical protein
LTRPLFGASSGPNGVELPASVSVINGSKAMPSPNPNLQSAYDQLCESYRAIDDVRMKLLGALPLATGTGIFVFLNKDAGPLLKENSLAKGIFGFLVTVGLALYEIYGIRKCLALIKTGTAIEEQWDVPGQFLTRPTPCWGRSMSRWREESSIRQCLRRGRSWRYISGRERLFGLRPWFSSAG